MLSILPTDYSRLWGVNQSYKTIIVWATRFRSCRKTLYLTSMIDQPTTGILFDKEKYHALTILNHGFTKKIPVIHYKLHKRLRFTNHSVWVFVGIQRVRVPILKRQLSDSIQYTSNIPAIRVVLPASAWFGGRSRVLSPPSLRNDPRRSTLWQRSFLSFERLNLFLIALASDDFFLTSVHKDITPVTDCPTILPKPNTSHVLFIMIYLMGLWSTPLTFLYWIRLMKISDLLPVFYLI
jgi:hypothetical protein